MRIYSTVNYAVSVLIIMMFLLTGCNQTDQGKIDEFALSFALKYLSDETRTFNDAVNRFHSFPSKDYAMPEMSEFSIASCTVSEWQGVKSYHYSVAHKINDANDVKDNWYGKSIHGDGSFLFGFRRIVYLTFVVEADGKGNLRVGNAIPVWKTSSGKSAEVYLNDTKQVIRQKTGRYP